MPCPYRVVYLLGNRCKLVLVQPADIAEAIEELPEAIQVLAFPLLSKDEAIANQNSFEDYKASRLLKILYK